ncbi:hypothetical protein HYFRA_00005154 [Hymenoscyphus fraxineus]|uniref:Eukaryotic translation initiation factor 3 subunit L n=1 Tax=Hymenoscyphus fraxineus TaxID=746836 RepID=A0A9N9L8A1_9HELO|nr:hypothetical protein HYFRA_00005154 [Hymenoscyphus fraxineus]
MSSFQNGGAPPRDLDDDSDIEEEALAANYREQVQYEGMEETPMSMAQQTDDIQSRLAAAAQPLDFSAPLDVKFASYDNYCSLFHFILNSDGPVDLEPPSYYWAWDVIDEFIYQFNSFCSYRNRIARQGNNEEEIAILREAPNTWGCYSVLNVLYSLIQRSQINEQLAAMKRNEEPMAVAGDYGSKSLYRMLGYFSIIGLLRVHCLLGDFSLALKTLDDIELNKKAMFARVMAAHFTTYYYVGFSYMMMRRYADAIRMFSHILIYVSRTKNVQKSAQYDSISKKNDQMYALIAICVAFHPTRLDDTIHTALREKYGDQLLKLQRGGPESLPIFEELFRSACPKFISPTPPDFDNPELNVDPLEHHLAIFMDEVKTNMWSPTVKSYLRLYTTMDLKKLAGFLEVEPEKLRGWLLVNKQRGRQIRWTDNGLLDGEVVGSGDLDYAMQGDLIHISEAKSYPSRTEVHSERLGLGLRLGLRLRLRVRDYCKRPSRTQGIGPGCIRRLTYNHLAPRPWSHVDCCKRVYVCALPALPSALSTLRALLSSSLLHSHHPSQSSNPHLHCHLQPVKPSWPCFVSNLDLAFLAFFHQRRVGRASWRLRALELFTGRLAITSLLTPQAIPAPGTFSHCLLFQLNGKRHGNLTIDASTSDTLVRSLRRRGQHHRLEFFLNPVTMSSPSPTTSPSPRRTESPSSNTGNGYFNLNTGSASSSGSGSGKGLGHGSGSGSGSGNGEASNANSPTVAATSGSPILSSQETLVTSPRLDPIIEHVVAAHTRPSRATSISSISFKSSSRGGPTSPIGQPKPARRIRDASPPPASTARQVTTGRLKYEIRESASRPAGWDLKIPRPPTRSVFAYWCVRPMS